MPRPITEFVTKSGRKIEVHEPSLKHLFPLLTFVNRLIEEDTFLTYTGRPKTLPEKRAWLLQQLEDIQRGRASLFWAMTGGALVGSCNILRGTTRDAHVADLAIMVDRDWRRDGIGRYLAELIFQKAKDTDVRIITLRVFSDNTIALDFYQKLGFKEYGRLPNGLFRQGKFSDNICMYKNLTDK